MPIFLRIFNLFFISFICWVTAQNVFAATDVTEKYEIAYDLQDNWLFYSSDDQSYLPYVAENMVDTKSVHFNLDLKRFTGEELIISSSSGLSLLIQNQYITYFDVDTTEVFSIDSLAAYYGINDIWITFYRPDGDFSQLKNYIGKPKIFTISRSPVNELESRPRNHDKSLFSLIIILIFGVYTFLLNVFPKDFKEFFNVSAVFTFRSVDEDIYKSRVLSKTQVLFLLGHSLLLSYLVILYFYFRNQNSAYNVVSNHSIVPWWIYTGFLLFILILSKYMLIYIFSLLFDIRDKINLYFFDFIKMSVSFYSLTFLFVVIIFFSSYFHLENVVNLLFNLAIIFSFIRFIVLYFKLRGSTTIKNLHLFSYLCSTELLPIVLGMRYFLN